MTEFLVHVGPHKTGTTYLQVTLDVLCDTLWDRGIYVPSIWNAAPGLPSHMQLVWAIRNRNMALVQRQVAEILALRPRYVVISCEGLSRLDQEQILQFRRLLGSVPAQVVYYVRRWPERLPSLWQETVKFGHTHTFSEFLAKQLTRRDDAQFRDTSTIDRFSAVFGASQVKIVCYSHLVDIDLDIVGHFLASFLGLSDIILPDVTWPNRSLPILDTELIRALNTIHLRHDGEKSPALRDWFLSCKDYLVPESLRNTMRDSMDKIHLDEAAPPSMVAFQDLLTRYAKSIVPPHHPDGSHELRAVDVPFVRQDYLLEPSVTTVLNDIYDVYRRALHPTELLG